MILQARLEKLSFQGLFEICHLIFDIFSLYLFLKLSILERLNHVPIS